jgi:glutathione S-transferase
MLTLRTSAPSPFGRKVRIALDMLGLAYRVTVMPADTQDPNDSLRTQNPLGKIPTLVLESGEALYDSRVIMQFIDALAGGGRIIPQGWARFDALRLEALADGILDANILQVYEVRFRPEEHRVAKWVEYQAEKVARALAEAEKSHAEPAAQIHVGHIALACALGHLDLRFEGSWRRSHPKLVAWLADFERRVPAFEATRVVA